MHGPSAAVGPWTAVGSSCARQMRRRAAGDRRTELGQRILSATGARLAPRRPPVRHEGVAAIRLMTGPQPPRQPRLPLDSAPVGACFFFYTCPAGIPAGAPCGLPSRNVQLGAVRRATPLPSADRAPEPRRGAPRPMTLWPGNAFCTHVRLHSSDRLELPASSTDTPSALPSFRRPPTFHAAVTVRTSFAQ